MAGGTLRLVAPRRGHKKMRKTTVTEKKIAKIAKKVHFKNTELKWRGEESKSQILQPIQS